MKPKFTKILKSDYPSLISVIFPVAIGLIYVLIVTDLIGFIPLRKFQSAADDPEAAKIFLWFFLGSLLVFLPLLGYRVAELFERFSNAVEVEGQIIEVNRFRDRGNIVFAFKYEDVEYRVSNAVHFSKEAKLIQEGQITTIVVPTLEPKKALIKSLFCED